MISFFFFICVVATTVDFYVFYLIGQHHSTPACSHVLPSASLEVVAEANLMRQQEVEILPPCEPASDSVPVQVAAKANNMHGVCEGWDDAHDQYLQPINSEEFEKYKGDHFVEVRYVDKSVLVSSHKESKCRVISNPYISTKMQGSCVAVVRLKDISASYHLMRYDTDPQYGGVLDKTNQMMPIGFFRKASILNGRLRLVLKAKPLFSHMSQVEQVLLTKLRGHGYMPDTGADVTVMVVNDGELDMFMNFACSCNQHNISMHNILVFAASEEIVPFIEVTGAMGVYHDSFAHVNREASEIYLDRVFVDMMWYKAFSVWLVLRLKFNVLFQDVDLVWFKDPWPYLKSYVSPVGVDTDTFWSDDGQRGLRYSPFYGNSGFYYIKYNPRTEFWAWSCITAFDTMHTSGSHQNVITTRLMESMDLFNVSLKILDLELFPTGVKYHHDKPYMQNLKAGVIKPFNYHMCWTSNKGQKISYFKSTGMWYLNDRCENKDKGGIRPHGPIFQNIMSRGTDMDKFATLRTTCCQRAL
jgi:hypothetical protein